MKRNRNTNYIKAVGACVGVVAALHAPAVRGSETSTNSLEKLAKENQDLKQRLDTLETLAQKEGLMPSGAKLDPPVSAMSQISLSGFVTASYFHDSSEPGAGNGNISPGYLWNRVNDNFSLNKVKATLASPQIENNGDKFDAGFRVSMIAGQDAPIVNTKSGVTGFDFIREAYVELNIPIGTGLDVRAGELISLLNYESGDGGAVNANFSQGFQWFFTGNPPEAGVQVGYKFTDWVGANFRVINGMYAGPIQNNDSKSFMGNLTFKPTKTLWFNIAGFGGRQDTVAQSLWGVEVIGGWQATDELNFGTELDYFNFHNPSTSTPPNDSPVWSAGLWTTYDFTKKVGLALRGEYLDDHDGVDAAGGALGFMNPLGTGQSLGSIALTLNYRPIPNLKIQPEIRWDHTSYAGGFQDGKQNRVIFGAGVSYLY
jgi:Putative beta-barrel porin-2, OmpL-like. bbp2